MSLLANTASLPRHLKVLTTTIALSVASTVADEANVSEGYQLQTLVAGSEFCGVHGLGINAKDELFAGSVVGERVYQIDTATGLANAIVLPPEGNADDIEFLPDGTMVWTSISQNKVRAQKPGKEVIELATNLNSVNSIAYDEKTQRLFVAQVFGGDALWEIDTSGNKNHREIVADMGGFNGFDVGPDGWLYGPLWFKGKIVKINPDSGEIKTVADGFHTPAAANFDSQWNLFALDTARGQVIKINIENGNKTVFAQLKTSLDNLAIDSNDNVYVSNMADNSIVKLSNPGGKTEVVVPGGLSCPVGVSIGKIENREQLFIADIFALRAVDTQTGAITDLGRSHAENSLIHYPAQVTSNSRALFTLDSGQLHQFSVAPLKEEKIWSTLTGVSAFTSDEKYLYTLHNRGSLLRRTDIQSGKEKIITEQLSGAVSLSAIKNNTLYAIERNTDNRQNGRLVAINLESGALTEITNQLDRPRGLDIDNDGNLVVMTGSPGKLLMIDSNSKKISLVADNIPVGNKKTSDGTQANGVRVGMDGAIYIIADGDNSILKITRQ